MTGIQSVLADGLSTAAALLIQAAGALFIGYVVLLLATALIGQVIGLGRRRQIAAARATHPAPDSRRAARALPDAGGPR